jgi:hypothetical protein
MLRHLALSSSSRAKACTSAVVERQVIYTATRALASTASESANDRHPLLGLLSVAAAAGLAGLAWNDKQSKTYCCGIAGVVGTPNHDAR